MDENEKSEANIIDIIRITFDPSSSDQDVHNAEKILLNFINDFNFFKQLTQIAIENQSNFSLSRSCILYIISMIKYSKNLFVINDIYENIIGIFNDSPDYLPILQKLSDTFVINADKQLILEKLVELDENLSIVCLYFSYSFSQMFSDCLKCPYLEDFVNQILPKIISLYDNNNYTIQYLCHSVFERCLFEKDISVFSQNNFFQLVELSRSIDIDANSPFKNEIVYLKMSMLSSILQIFPEFQINFEEFKNYFINNVDEQSICTLYYPIYTCLDQFELRHLISIDFFQKFLNEVFIPFLDNFILKIDENFYGYSLIFRSEDIYKNNWCDPIDSSASLARVSFKAFDSQQIFEIIENIILSNENGNDRISILAMWYLSNGLEIVSPEMIDLFVNLSYQFLNSENLIYHIASFLFLAAADYEHNCDVVKQTFLESFDLSFPEEIRSFAIVALPQVVQKLDNDSKSLISSNFDLLEIFSILIQNFLERETDNSLTECKNFIKAFPEIMTLDNFSQIFEEFLKIFEYGLQNDKSNISMLSASIIAFVIQSLEPNPDFHKEILGYLENIMENYSETDKFEHSIAIAEALFKNPVEELIDDYFSILMKFIEISQYENSKIVFSELSQMIIYFIYDSKPNSLKYQELISKATEIFKSDVDDLCLLSVGTEIIASFMLNLDQEFFNIISVENITEILSYLIDISEIDSCPLLIAAVMLKIPEIFSSELRNDLVEIWTKGQIDIVPFLHISTVLFSHFTDSEKLEIISTAEELISLDEDECCDFEGENFLRWPWFNFDKSETIKQFKEIYGIE
ncbi:hypothetical protein TVAG_166150 [Trichomonas vaginalis G3]|uniref:Uncharacterized protein n=1 Tax=Trichomonas vaginalis (strain ATCC PRA-98 / G3) TaxID=412133 RepID=A2DE22_TRIV3|nr:armadillo (ARM) repeat-containing protein family [Trichomonas vaginalis G3]EAY21240.1 hypothetical protein TVAG_166150 [Trichomonas vaginalis G3]KAI5548803.1 armadillo (ARM) repeat-containing protein family [Trichomonas vaginalis G3]|eukprot:XP_001582226.1 hypothetical protein [Trichomonas vaginalis G3]